MKSLIRRFVENRRKHVDDIKCGEILNPGDTMLVTCKLDKNHPSEHKCTIKWSVPKRF
jgi:hypothetical protein